MNREKMRQQEAPSVRIKPQNVKFRNDEIVDSCTDIKIKQSEGPTPDITLSQFRNPLHEIKELLKILKYKYCAVRNLRLSQQCCRSFEYSEISDRFYW
jgi:hypothetical protein